jgi:hypothetical protein
LGIKNDDFFLKSEEDQNIKNKLSTIFSPSYFQSSLKTLNKSNNSETNFDFVPGFFTIRCDGSYSLGKWDKKNISRTRLSCRTYASLLGKEFFYEPSLNSNYFDLLLNFTQYLKSKKITICYFLAPVHPIIYASCNKSQNSTEMEQEIRKLANKFNVLVLGSYNPNKYPALIKNEYFIDFYHLSSEGMKIVMDQDWK